MPYRAQVRVADGREGAGGRGRRGPGRSGRRNGTVLAYFSFLGEGKV